MELEPRENTWYELPERNQRWLEIANRRRPPYDTFSGWYERVWSNLQSPDDVASRLGITVDEVEELAFENSIFSIEEEGHRYIPLEQFEHLGGYESGVRQVNYQVSARLEMFWRGLDELIPHCADSKWLVWSLLFWKQSGICAFTTGGVMRALVNCSDEDWPSVSSEIRERLVAFEQGARNTDIATLNAQAGVHIR